MGARRRHKQKPAVVVSEPVEIPDAEHELVVERVAGIDVAKAAGKVCVRLPGRSGRRFSRVWDVPARTGAITEVAERRTGADSIRFIHREFATKCANPADTAGACSGHDGNI